MPRPLDETSVSLLNECARWSRRSNCLPSLTGVHFAGRQGRGLGSGVSQPAAARNGRLAKSRRRRERIRWYPVFVVDGGDCSNHERPVAPRTRRIWFAKRTSRGFSHSPTNGFPFALRQGPQIVDMHGKSREVISRLCRRAKGNRRCAVREKTTERSPMSWECTWPTSNPISSTNYERIRRSCRKNKEMDIAAAPASYRFASAGELRHSSVFISPSHRQG